LASARRQLHCDLTFATPPPSSHAFRRSGLRAGGRLQPDCAATGLGAQGGFSALLGLGEALFGPSRRQGCRVDYKWSPRMALESAVLAAASEMRAKPPQR